MRDEYDVIVIGAGVNGLAAAAYMAKLGQKVAVFEARNEIGTNCDTEEVMRPGVRCNLHASGMGVLTAPSYEELEMERFGYEPLYAKGGWGYYYPFLDGTAFALHNYDTTKTYELLKALNEHDANVFRDICNYFAKGDLLVEMTHLSTYAIPSPEVTAKLAQILNDCPHIPTGSVNMTGYHLLDIMFEDERIKVGIISTMVELGPDPWIKGVGALGIIMGLLIGPTWAYLSTPRGGSHLVPHSLYRCLLHYGGEVYQSCAVKKIIVENGAAKGIVLSKDSVYPGRTIKAKKAVISDLTPVPTFLWLVGAENLPQWVTNATMNYDYEGQVLFTNYYLMKEPLMFDSFKWTDKLDPKIGESVFMYNCGVETVEDSARLKRSYAMGQLPDPAIMFGGCFRYTTLDPTQAPAGMHTVLLWADVPFNIRRWKNKKLNGPGDWDLVREEYADEVENVMAKYAPNIKTAKVERYVHTPLDINRRNASMLMGTWSGGSMEYNQWGENRPFAGCGAPRTPIKNLYITEVNITRSTLLTGGYGTAMAVAEDLGVLDKKWMGKIRGNEPYMRYCERVGWNWKIKI